VTTQLRAARKPGKRPPPAQHECPPLARREGAMHGDVFHADLAHFSNRAGATNAGSGSPSTQRLKIRTPDDSTLVGIRIPSIRRGTKGAPTLVGFGGNAWNARTMIINLHRSSPYKTLRRGRWPSVRIPSAPPGSRRKPPWVPGAHNASTI
jgi:hypothetical protein